MTAIGFDVLGTLACMDGVPREEIRAYLAQCVDPMWKPLNLPEHWNKLPAFPDVAEGLRRLRTKYKTYTLSNLPAPVAMHFQINNELEIDAVYALESIKRYKPHPECYLSFCRIAGVEPHEAMMVTANPTFGPYPFGDIHIAGAIGMKTQLIRNPGCPQTIIELAEQLGC